MRFAITFTFRSGCSFTDIFMVSEGCQVLEPKVEFYPFPNKKGNCQAFGLMEYYQQSDKYGTLFSLELSDPAYCLVMPYEEK